MMFSLLNCSTIIWHKSNEDMTWIIKRFYESSVRYFLWMLVDQWKQMLGSVFWIMMLWTWNTEWQFLKNNSEIFFKIAVFYDSCAAEVKNQISRHLVFQLHQQVIVKQKKWTKNVSCIYWDYGDQHVNAALPLFDRRAMENWFEWWELLKISFVH